MSSWTLAFLLLALLAALLDFTGLAGTASWFVKALAGILVVLLVVALIFGRNRTT